MISDWPLSPALLQRQQQLEFRKQLEKIAKIERADAAAANAPPFSPAAFIRSDTKSSTATGTPVKNMGTESGFGGTTPRGLSTVKYEMGFSNVKPDKDGGKTFVAADNSDRNLTTAEAQKFILSQSGVSQAATKADPHIPNSSRITHGGRNPLGSPATNVFDLASPIPVSRSPLNSSTIGESAFKSGSSAVSGGVARQLNINAQHMRRTDPSRSFVEHNHRSRSAGPSVSMASKFNAFSQSLNDKKHATRNASLNNSSLVTVRGELREAWQPHINAKIPPPKSPTTSAKANQSAADANKLLEKHLNDLIAMKFRCDRALDAMGKEYSVLLKDCDEAERVIATLGDRYREHSKLLEKWNALPALATESPSFRHQQQRLGEIAAVDPHRGAFRDGMWTLNPLHNEKPTESMTRHGEGGRQSANASFGAAYSAAVRAASRGGSFLGTSVSAQSIVGGSASRPDTAAFVGLNNAEKALQYVPVILKEIAFLRGRIDKCRQLIADTESSNDKLQHMSMLIDVATNVDLACLGRIDSEAASIVVPASPAFPNLTLSDFDQAENEAASLTSYCTRAASELRRAVQSAVAGHSQCFDALVAAMKLGVKCAEAKREECERQINEIDRDTLARVQRALDDCLQEEAVCEERLKSLEKIISLRKAALESNVFGDRGGYDPVVAASEGEGEQIQIKMREIEVRKEKLIREYDQLQHERQQLEETAACADVSEQLVDEIKRSL